MVTELINDTKKHTLNIADLLPLDVVFEKGAIAMRKLDKDNLENLQMASKADIPAITVVHVKIDGKDAFVTVDGYHRQAAFQANGETTIEAQAQAFKNEQEVIETAFEANMRHGLKSSTETRSAYAIYLHLEYPDMTQEKIAAKCGVLQSTVSRAIERYDKRIASEKAKAIAESSADTATEGEEGEEAVTETVDFEQVFKKFVKQVIAFNVATSEIETDAEIERFLELYSRKPEEAKAVLERVGKLLVNASKIVATKKTTTRAKADKPASVKATKKIATKETVEA